MPLPLHIPYKEEQFRPWGGYGSMELDLLKGRPKLRASLVPIFFSIVLPWCLFAFTYLSVASSMHLTNPAETMVALACGALLLICMFFAWLDRLLRWRSPEPSTLGFFGFSFLLAWIAGILLGTMSYQTYTLKWFELTRLNTYKGVDPDVSRGAQLMDAGFINFLPGTHVEVNISMGYKDESLYCVAPLQLGPLPLVTYDFWLIGKDCCQASKRGFSCGSAKHLHSSGMIARRVLADDLDYYKLAVRQAEAAYGIMAAHPLFFEQAKVDEVPEELVNQAQQALQHYFLGYLGFQFLLVILAIFFYFPPSERR